MRYFIITSGPAKGIKLTWPEHWTEKQLEETVLEISIDMARPGSFTHQEITAEQYADAEDGEE